MADFYRARLSASYLYKDGKQERTLDLVRYGLTLLPQQPAKSWNLPNSTFNLVGRNWAMVRPTGNSTLALSLSFLHPAPTVAQAEAWACRLEYTANIHRSGTLHLHEAFDGDTPLMLTTWQAVIASASARLCTMDEAPAITTHTPAGQPANAWATATLGFILTNPTF